MWVFKMKDGDRHRAVNSTKTLFVKSLTHLTRVLKPTSAAFYVLKLNVWSIPRLFHCTTPRINEI